MVQALVIVATVVQFWAGSVFYRSAWAAARHGETNINTLVAVGTSVAYAYSAFVTLRPSLAVRWGFQPDLYFDITLVGGDLRTIARAIGPSRRSVHTIKQGLLWAFAYNIVLVPVAMGIVYPWFGVLLSPVLAAAAMAMSSVSVVANALRLRNFRPGRAGLTASV